MLHLSENLRKFRITKNMTQEDVAECLQVTPQSVSKWERGDCYPDITFLPALANIFETSIDLLIGMDIIRAEETRYQIHLAANEIDLMERGLPISINEKQKSTTRAALCFLYLKCGRIEKANELASELPHTRESREVIQPLIAHGIDEHEINENIKKILNGNGNELW